MINHKRWMDRKTGYSLLLVLCFLVCSLVVDSADATENTSVFVLHSYSQEYPWTKRQHEGFMQRLRSTVPNPTTVCVEYLDAKRVPYTADYANLMAEYLGQKYKAFKPKIIYVTDDNALAFAVSHLTNIFPNTPVFFSGVNDYKVKSRLSPDRFTGVFERKEVAPSLELMRSLAPDMRDILVVGDKSETFQTIRNEIEVELQQYPDIHARFLSDDLIEPLVESLHGSSERYVLLTTLEVMKDASVRVLTIQEAISSIAQAGPFIILCMEDVYLCPGVMGGYVTSGLKQGDAAAEMAIRHLAGAAVADIVPVESSPNEYIFDAKELNSIGLHLPPEIARRATILNSLPTFYERNFDIIVSAFCALVLLFLVLLGIFHYLVVRKNQRIAKSEASLAEAQRIAHLGHWELNLTTSRLDGSAEMFNIFEIVPQEIGASYKAFLDTIHPEDRTFVDQAYTNSLKNRTPYNIIHRLLMKDGSVKFVNECCETLYDDLGKPLRSIGTVQDITQRKQVEEEYRSLSNLLRLTADTAQDMIWVKDVNGKYLFANKAICENLLGAKDTNEPLGKTDMYFALRERGTHPSDPNWHTFGELCLNSDEITVNADKPMRFNEFGNIGGVYTMLDVCKSPLRDKDGRTIGVVGTARDITEQKRVEEALRDRENLLKAILESTADGILVVNNNGRATHWNRKFHEMWRIPQDIIETRDDNKMLELVLGQLSDPEPFLNKVRALYMSSDESTDSLKFIDGRVFERYSCPLYRDETLVGRVWSFRDMTQRRKAEETRQQLQERLEKAQRMESLGLLAGGVAHDLNNTLSPIVGYSYLLISDFADDVETVATLEKIAKSAENAAVVIQDLLTLSRRGRYEMQPTDLNSVIREFIDSPIFESMKERNPKVTVEINLGSSIGSIEGSEPHLAKAIMNLVTNAFDAMPAGGALTIQTEQAFIEALPGGHRNIDKGNYVLIRVRDTGLGIPAEDIDKIFEPYFSRKKMGRSGSGLGLSVVYGVVKDHNGYYDVLSEIRKGTEFVLYFPISITANPSRPIVQRKTVGGKETILIVDDDPCLREMGEKIITRLGYTAQMAENGRLAIEIVSSNAVDLIMLDMIMEPDFDGLDTYREILKIHPNQKAIVVSGYAATDRVQEILTLGASSYIRKPYSIEGLAMALRGALDSTSLSTVNQL